MRSDRILRTDGWSDLNSGLGAAGGKGQNLQFQKTTELDTGLLSELYEGDWLARRVVEKIVDLSLMTGFTIQDMDQGAADTLIAQFLDLNISRHAEGAFQRGQYLGRLYGGAGIILGFATGGDSETPVPEGSDLAYLETVTKEQLTVPKNGRYDDPTKANFGLPEFYKIAGGPFNGVTFHESRIIRTVGLTKVSDIEEPEWGLSVLQPIVCTISRYGLAWESVSSLLQEASIGVMKIQGLIEMIGSKDTSLINARADVVNVSKTVARTIFLDAEKNETFERTNVSFSDVPEILSQIMQDMAGAADMPAMLLFGQTPTGLNTTGEGDLQTFYDTTDAARQQRYKPQLERILSLLAKREIVIEFKPLWRPSEQVEATTRLAQLQGDQILFNTGAVEGEEIVLARKVGQSPEEFVEETVLEDRLTDDSSNETAPTIPGNTQAPGLGADVVVVPEGDPAPDPGDN